MKIWSTVSTGCKFAGIFHLLARELASAMAHPPIFSSPYFSALASYNLGRERIVSQSEIVFSFQESPKGGIRGACAKDTRSLLSDELNTMLRDALACPCT